jgi:RimJ/RimL family protein N-acetyltransferase
MTDLSQLQLTTPRLRLRPLQAGDAAALWAIFSDPAVMRYWSTPPWTDLQQAEAMIAADAEHLPAGRHARLALEPLAGGSLIGTCTLFDIVPDSRRCEIGYALGHAHWGRGLMNEALQALIGLAFGELAMRRIEADIDPRNAGSARTLERLGFVREGLLRERWQVGDEVSDTALYGLLRRDWRPPVIAT